VSGKISGAGVALGRLGKGLCREKFLAPVW
jgi:hypothetical protein